jgi:hypothetical protein
MFYWEKNRKISPFQFPPYSSKNGGSHDQKILTQMPGLQQK